MTRHRPDSLGAQPTPQPADRAGEARQQFRPRAKLCWAVEFEFVEDIADDVRDPRSIVHASRRRGRTHGISIGGAFIETDLDADPDLHGDPAPTTAPAVVAAVAPAVGRSLRLWLYPPALSPDPAPELMRLHGEVRWIHAKPTQELPTGFGVAFRAMTATDEIRLHGYFSRSAKML